MQACWIFDADVARAMREVFASLKSNPRTLFVKIENSEGEYFFNDDISEYIPEHKLPLKLSKCRPTYLLITPAKGERFHVRRLPTVPLLSPFCHRLSQLMG